jgi:hypothetical protein
MKKKHGSNFFWAFKFLHCSKFINIVFSLIFNGLRKNIQKGCGPNPIVITGAHEVIQIEYKRNESCFAHNLI